MKKIICILTVVFFIGIINASVFYNSEQSVSSVGGTSYYLSKTSSGSVSSTITRISIKQDNPGYKYFRPLQSVPEGTVAFSTTPIGYGWVTDVLTFDIDPGIWRFNVTTKNSRGNNGRAYIEINVFKYCNGVNDLLFHIHGNSNIFSSSSTIIQTIATNQPGYSVNGCRLKLEYWLNSTRVEEDCTNTLQQINTGGASIEIPLSSQGQQCADADSDGYTATSCGGNDCNDNNANIYLGATETCNNIDDNCNSQIDDGLTQQSTCGVGACIRTITQTCSAGSYLPNCVPGQPLTDICGNGIDDDCDGTLDNNCGACTPGINLSCGSSIGICRQGIQTCLSNGSFGSCIGGIFPDTEICNNSLDDNCNLVVDENCQIIVNNLTNFSICIPGDTEICGSDVGSCQSAIKTCKDNGKWGQCTDEVKPTKEICDLNDNDCDGLTDEDNICLSKNITKSCIENWNCTEWSDCSKNNISSRNCYETNNCKIELRKPIMSKDCFSNNNNISSIDNSEKQVIQNNVLLYMSLIIGILGVVIAWIISIITVK